ncbi:MAG: hypothetical protein JSS98_04635 [Bacteroidetes bacterium]|nr:hypothetical protein [Bacteroidota bacterium]
MKNKFEKEVESAFSGIDGIKRAKAPDWFYTKLEAKMLRQANPSKGYWENVSAWLTRPAVVLAGLFLILFLNATVLYLKPSSTNDSVATASEQTASDEYKQVSATLFDYETIKP